MIEIHTLVLGDYQTNCYIVRQASSKSCAVIDPGDEAETILARVKKLGLTVDAVLLTHGHFDHVGAVEDIVEATGCKLWMSERDWVQPIDPLHTCYYPIANCDFTEVLFCRDQQAISAGGLTFTVYATPGHTCGSVCYLCEDVLFSGDTLFAGSCGRTDLPGGSSMRLRDSLGRLAAFDNDLILCPGHGTGSTMAEEKKYNPYLR